MKLSLDEPNTKSKPLIMVILVALACILTYYFHFILRTDIVFSQFYYIPVIISALWWKRKGIWVAFFLAFVLIFSELISPIDPLIIQLYRVMILFSVSIIIIFISERIEKSQIELAESEEKYRNIVETTHEGVLTGDIDGTILYVNQRMCDLFGYKKEEVLNHNIFEFVDENKRNIFVEVRKKVLKGEKVTFTPEFRRKDGSILWTLAQASPLYDGQGNQISNLFMHSDITELKKTQEALEDSHSQLEKKVEQRTRELTESEEKYRTLFDKDPDYNLLINVDGVIVEINKALTNLLGLSKNELVGKNFTELGKMEPEDISFILGKLSLLLDGNVIEPFEIRFKDKNNDIHWGLIHITPIMDNGKISYVLVIATDITRQKSAENEIKTSLGEKEALLREIHHRVNNNMQIISSLLNLQKEYVSEDETRDVLQDSQSRVKSMAMVHEKLYLSGDLSHINFKQYTEKLVSDIFYTYESQIDRIRPIFNLENVELNMETAIPLGLIINELVANSLKFAFPNNKKGSITVEMKTKNGEYALIVSDDGIGFPADIDFKKTNSLGLKMVNNLVNQLDGEITLDRSHGTEYKITFKELNYKKRLDLKQ
ncbi:PAS domain S-box protein [uncultured Methanobacterium sp.]|uniref:PAS domain S-box protein n=1 Tax=uncultured Methanobacterium sp. TaxID=176306 RepID=UPI002AA801A1|nr:PAS domain S-box protein [uncultured Methanobacterium sp.]